MITQVRVAPMERWCEAAKRFVSPKIPREIIAGYVIAIETESMGPSFDCNGKSWLVAQEDSVRARAPYGLRTNERYRVCEHMLELD